MPIPFEKQLERLLDQAGGWTPGETARAAGALLDLAGVSRDTVEQLVVHLGNDDREELYLQMLDHLPQ